MKGPGPGRRGAGDPIPRIVLGPQRLLPTLGRELDALDITGELACITAGWQERESEDEELRKACGGLAVRNLRLYERWELIQKEDPELATAHRARQDDLRRLRDLYRLRLDGYKKVLEQVTMTAGPAWLIEPEREAAIDAVRRADAHHLARIRRIRAEFETQWMPTERPAVARHREELIGLIGDSSAVLVAGGHVAVLLNRLQLFGLDSALAGRPIIAWSAGAMALSDRVVLFHDHPPQGDGRAEVFEEGLGLLEGLVVLPHARHRLRLSSAMRVSSLARRFAPATCIALDEGDRIGWPDGVPGRPAHCKRLLATGQVEAVGGREGPNFPVSPSLEGGVTDDVEGGAAHSADRPERAPGFFGDSEVQS